MTAKQSNTKIDLRKIISNAQLPALPQSAIRLLELSQNPANGPDEFAVPIESDPGLAGQVLKFVNSSYFGFTREISTVKHAITMVGIRTIKNFSLWSAVFSLMPNPKCGPFDLKSLWSDSLRRGLFARAMARQLGMTDPEEPFAAALLQDMAVPLLAKEMPEVYAKLLAKREDGRTRLSGFEQQLFGWTHADAAAMMARHWNLPDEFAALVQQHTHIDELVADPNRPPGKTAVALSSLLPAGADGEWEECAEFDRYYQLLSRPDGPTLEELLRQVDEEFKDFAPVLNIKAASNSLADTYRELMATAQATAADPERTA